MRLSEESQDEYRIRLFENKDIYELTFDDIAELLNFETGQNFGESAYRKEYAAFNRGRIYERESNPESEVFEQTRQLQKERIKLQTEKLEYNRWLREDARDELFLEKIIDAIRENCKDSFVPKKVVRSQGNRAGLLSIADCHFGKEFQLLGLDGEVINSYSPEIFYDRMENLFNEATYLCKESKLTEIDLFSLGDTLDGFLRHSQLWTLRYGVVDSSIIYGNFIADWIKKLSETVFIRYHQTNGNHCELRLLDGRKDEHLNENIEKIVLNTIKIKNEKNPNLSVIENPTGFAYANILGFEVLGIHGQVKDLSKAVKDYSDFYHKMIDYIVGGHKHHSAFVNCGAKKGAIGVGSIVGTDDFSHRLIKSADASASFTLFEESKGRIREDIIVLN